ncbi:MAG: hypothetical protein ACLSVD_15265 [Eggerthellaceae bacterium]
MVIRSYNDCIAHRRNDIEDDEHASQWAAQEEPRSLTTTRRSTPLATSTPAARPHENMLKHHRRAVARTRVAPASHSARDGTASSPGLPGINVTERAAIRDLADNAPRAVDVWQKLASPESDEPAEDVSTLLLEYQRSITALRNANPSITALTNTASKAQDIERYGLRLELEQIQARYEDGDLCRSSYKRLRENVALMQVDLEDNV